MPFLAVRARLHLAKVYWSLAEQTTAHHLLREIDDVLLHRPALGVLVDDVAELPARSTSTSVARQAGLRSPRRSSAAAVPADAPHDARGGRPAVRVPQHGRHTQVGAIYRKLGVSSRSEAVAQATAIGLLGGSRDHLPPLAQSVHFRRNGDTRLGTLGPRASSVSYPRASASLGAATRPRQPDDGTTPTSTSTISAAVAPALTAASVCAP